MSASKMVIGITQGDPNGVGLEIVLKTFSDPNIYKYCTPVLYANPKLFVFWKKQLNLQEPMYNLIPSASKAQEGKLNLVISSEESVELTIGKPGEAGGLEALKSLNKAIDDAEHLHAIVTSPLDKSTVAHHLPNFSGHTGYLAEKMGVTQYAMVLTSEELRVALVTEHVSIAELPKHLTTERISNKIGLLSETLKSDFNVTKPRIAVLALNPHAGDNGLLGKEEEQIIKPAIEEHYKAGVLVYGPYSADSFFGSGNYKNFDAILAMYHDQGLIPFKTFAFHDGVNVTVGLPIVRTSPDHGTAYDIAGKGIAECISFRSAVYEAVHLVRNKRQIEVDYSNQLPYAELRRERFRIDF
jgi:4-hydroxythreonine-4-phosphate dehydrogenase